MTLVLLWPFLKVIPHRRTVIVDTWPAFFIAKAQCWTLLFNAVLRSVEIPVRFAIRGFIQETAQKPVLRQVDVAYGVAGAVKGQVSHVSRMDVRRRPKP